MKIGVCTGGGDCPGLNAAIRAVVKHGIGSHKMDIVGIRDSFNGLQVETPRTVDLDLESVTDILMKGGTILGTHNKGNPFANPDTRQKAIKATIDGYHKLKLDGLIVIGGEGTQAMSATLIGEGMNIVGVPKTIDNDLPGTETTIGFATAVDIVAEAVGRLRSTAESHDRVMVLEVMGRDSGHIALHGGLAGGANIILLPEIAFSYKAIVAKLNERKGLGRNFSVVVVAEGATEMSGEQLYTVQPEGQKTLGGIGARVASEINERTDMDTRVTVLGHVQRGGPPNAVDRILATQMAVKAVDLVAAGKFGYFAAVQNGAITSTAYSDIEAHARQEIPMDSTVIASAESIGVNLGRP